MQARSAGDGVEANVTNEDQTPPDTTLYIVRKVEERLAAHHEETRAEAGALRAELRAAFTSLAEQLAAGFAAVHRRIDEERTRTTAFQDMFALVLGRLREDFAGMRTDVDAMREDLASINRRLDRVDPVGDG
jgi:hypothetical protein